jgi:hypothetical protein
MRKLVLSMSAVLFLLLAGCGDHTTEEACENDCSCSPIGRDGVGKQLCVSACVDALDKRTVSNECIDCIAEATCKELSDDKCESVCD